MAFIAALMVIVVTSYRQTVRAYPDGGGAFIVAHDNLGLKPAMVAAASLLTDYVLTVAVSILAIAAVEYWNPDFRMVTTSLSRFSVVVTVLAALALLAFGIGVCAFFEKEGTQMERIPPDDISRYGMNTNHERMDNGELRFRLMSTDGSGYIRTVAGEKGAWQNSHSHAYVLETYVVQSGWMVLAEFQNGKLVPELLEPGKAVTTRIGIVHNVYLPRGAVIHTVKHGIAQQKDWIPSDDFDKMTKPLSEQELLKIVGRTPGTPPSAPTP
jgi:quercetin dioxygenase-like cupin family protein